MVIDSHAHINSKCVKDIENTIKKINDDDNLLRVINVAIDYDTSREIIKYSKNNNKIYNTVGIHPLYSNSGEDYYFIRNLIDEKTVAIGEIGLDNSKDNILEQKIFLMKQIILANECKLPVIIHSNNMNKEVIEIFEKYVKPKYGCVFHCFQPEIDILNYMIENKFYISFAGRITYKTANKSVEVLKQVPNDLFLIETDSPYISPEPVRNEINESSNIKYIENKICKIKNISKEELDDIVNANTKRLFKKLR